MSSSTGRSGRTGDSTEGRKHAAGAFDIRNIIAGLIGVYGVVLVLMGIFANGPDEQRRTGDVNANLWAGLVMVVFAIVFFVWSRLRPVVVDIVVSVLVTQVTKPKPVRELAGLVYSETPKEDRTDPDASRLPWYQSPTKLATISLVMVVALNIIFR